MIERESVKILVTGGAGRIGSAVCRETGDQVTHVTDRPGHDRRCAIDTARLETELGWRARETDIRGTVEWRLGLFQP